MKGKMIGRILDRRAVLLYLSAWLLLFAVTPGQRGAMDVLGGFSPRGSRGLDIPGIMRWNLCVLPPVAASILFVETEMGALRNFTMMRAKNAKRWFLMRFTAIAAANLIFLLPFTGTAEALMGRGEVGSGRFFVFLILFFGHSFVMSMVSVAFFAGRGGIRASVISFLTVEGVMVVIGNAFPPAAACLPTYWGMIRQVEEAYDGGGLYPALIMGATAAAIAGSAVFIIRSLRA